MDNPINALRKFFAGHRGEVTLAEFTTFWRALSNGEKDEFRAAAERWDGASEFIAAASQPTTDAAQVLPAAA